jgi:LmbE family N-acetylglucosaminyl deacetylase
MKLLAIFAHPDDESYGPAGTLAQATRNGHSVALLTLTHGESGSLGISKNLSSKKLAKLRRRELHCAAKILGIQEIKMHDLPDKQLSAIPAQQGIAIIKQEIKRFKPDTIITFHENTISGHPDHLAVTLWTIMTVKSLQDPPQLFFYGLDQEQTEMVAFRKFIPITNGEITHRLNVEDFIDDKIAAIQCHETQNAFWQQFEKSNLDFKSFSKWEVFVQKWPKPENKRIKRAP